MTVRSSPSLRDAFSARSYPGRGFLLGSVRGERVVVYFVTGRSDASRRRSFKVEGASVTVTDANDSSHDPLRHYRAVAVQGEWLVVGNGSHVDQIAAGLTTDIGALEIMSGLAPEPDPPIYTPRIWVALCEGDRLTPSILGHTGRRSDGGTVCGLWTEDELVDDTAVLLTTYSGSATDVTVTEGPMHVSVDTASAEELLTDIWGLLDPEIRVGAVLVRPDVNNSISVVGAHN